MPAYDYQCDVCGVFEVRAPIAQGRPADLPCPVCGTPAGRVYGMPAVGMSAARRAAHDINEKSAHDPSVVKRSKSHNHIARSRPARPWQIGH